MIIAIETTIDLVGMNDTNHGKRVGYIASQLAHKLGFSKQEIQFVFELGLLHDCGVSTHQMHSNLVNHFDWEDAHIHCEIGYRLLKKFAPLEKYALPILHHHTAWHKLNNVDISEADKQLANIIYLSDRVDVLAATHYEKDILLARREIIKSILSYSGDLFDPLLINNFIELEKTEAFWISLESRHISRFTWDMGYYTCNQRITMEQLKQLSLIMAYIVDQKSPFTAQHSARVGCLARYIAVVYHLSIEQCDKIEIAGFLHDIGKLRMPDDILEKNTSLNNTERSIMNQHSYETYEILRHINGLEDIALWAAYHHEGIDGTGYPFHPTEKNLSIEARIISVADIFQALAQNRPYRKGLALDEIVKNIEQYKKDGKLDKSITELVINHANQCYQIAIGEAEENKDSEFPFFATGDLNLKEQKMFDYKI